MTKRYDLEDIFKMWDEIPDDIQDDTDELSSSDEDIDNDYNASIEDEVSEMQEVSNEEVSNEEATTTASKSNEQATTTESKKKVPKKRASGNTQKKDKTLEQLKKVEEYLVKNDLSYPLSADEIKRLQALLAKGKNDKPSPAQVKSWVEIARRQWKKINKPLERNAFILPEGPVMEHFIDCQMPCTS